MEKTQVSITLKGNWRIERNGSSDVTVTYNGGNTELIFTTFEAATEEISLKYEN